MLLRGILEGFASILEIQPEEVPAPRSTRKRHTPKTRMTDAEAIASDWAAVGVDLRTAIDKHRHGH